MTKISELKSVEEFIKVWPRLATLARAHKNDVKEILNMFLMCLSDGVVFLVKTEYGLVGSCCILVDGTEGVLLSLPTSDESKLGQQCLSAVGEWAKKNEVKSLRVTSRRLCGSSYRYFEKSLGFRRNTVTFTKEL